jgi:tetrathionate reductase subunit A
MPAVEQRLQPEEVRRTAMVMSRGGRFDKIEDAWNGGHVKAAYAFPVQLWHEGLAGMHHSMTGERYSGCPKWYPTRFADGSDMRTHYPLKD